MPSDSTSIDAVNCWDCGPFYLDVVGRFPAERIRVVPSARRRFSTPELDDLIEKTWQAQLQSARQMGRLLYDGRLHRLVEFRCENDVLELTLGPTGFKEFLGTNLTHAHLRHLHGPEVLANVLGVSAAVCTGDGYVLLGRRSGLVVAHAGRIHAVGGVLESSSPDGDAAPASLPHPSAVILHELREELGIAEQSVRSNLCLGMVRDRHIVQPELIFDVTVDIDVPSLRRFQPPREHAEHSELVAIRDHPSAVVTFIEQNYGDLTPVAQATLLLHGLDRWGSGWFAATRGYLRSVV